LKAFLLAGGLGERLRPLTDSIPKCLVPINGVPLLEIWLRLCERYSIGEVQINVSRHADLVERFLQEGAWNVDIRLIREANPIGNAGTVLAQRDFVAREESFFILYSDNLTDVALDRLAALHATHDEPLTMGLFRTPTPSAAGLVQLRSDGLVVGFEEKPAQPAGNLANAGVYVARQSLFDEIPPRGPIIDFGRDVLPRLVNRMYARLIDEFLLDIGSPEALAAASRLWAERHELNRSRD
jgi:mannose-1-phosphate guanylyltransferase